MKADMFDSVKNTVIGMVMPVGEIPGVTVRACEKIAQVQLDAMRFYSQIGFSRMRTAATIRDYGSARQFAVGQIEVMGEIGKKMVDDSRTVVDIGKTYASEVRGLFSEEKTAKASAPAKKDVGKKPAVEVV